MRVIACSLLTLSCFGASYTTASNPRVLAFEARKAEYVAQGAGYALSVTTGGAVLNLRGHAVGMSVAGASPRSSLEALDRMPGKANYLLGRGFRASYDLYGRVRWRGVNPGIDVVFQANREGLDYHLEIGAGRDPGVVRLVFGGIDGIRIGRNGELVLDAGAERIRQARPVAWQTAAGQRQLVEASYAIDEANHVGFHMGAYNHALPLVIGSQLVFDTPFGGSGVSYAAGMARDAQGNLYITGTTDSSDLGVVNAYQSHMGSVPLTVTANGGQFLELPVAAGASTVTQIVAAPASPNVEYAVTPIGIFPLRRWRDILDRDCRRVAREPGIRPWRWMPDRPIRCMCDFGGHFRQHRRLGTSWQGSTNGSIAVTQIGTVAASPSQPGVVLAATNYPGALYRSTDFGQSWTEVLSAPSDTAVFNPIVSLAIAPSGAIVGGTYRRVTKLHRRREHLGRGEASQGVENIHGPWRLRRAIH